LPTKQEGKKSNKNIATKIENSVTYNNKKYSHKY